MAILASADSLRADLPDAYDDAVSRVSTALAAEGFGILTEIDVKETLKKKLDVDFRRYVILGACNPGLAYRALDAEREVGLLLPCNVIVFETDDGGSSVAVLDPVSAMGLAGDARIEPVANEAREALERVVAALRS